MLSMPLFGGCAQLSGAQAAAMDLWARAAGVDVPGVRPLLGRGAVSMCTPPCASLTGGSSFCQLGTVVSCAVVNKSAYAELLGVPVAVLGVCWFVVLLALTLRAPGEPRHTPWALLGWCGAGAGFVGYLLYAEYALGTLCPFCTVVHLLSI